MSGQPTSDPDIDRLLQSLQGSRIESGEAPGDPDIARLQRSLAKGEEPPPTPREINTAESGPALQNPAIVAQRQRIAARPSAEERTEADKQKLESSLKEDYGVQDASIDMEKVVPGAKLRFLMGRSKDFQDFRQRFEDTFGKGAEMVRAKDANGKERVLFREAPDQPWGIAGEDVATGAGKILTVPLLTTAAAAVATSGASVPAQIGAQAAAGFVGELADVGLNKFFGYDKGVGAISEATKTGAIAAGGANIAPVASAISAVGEKISGFSLGKLFNRDFAQTYAGAAERQGLEAPMIGQTTSDPKEQTLFRQVSGTSAAPRERLQTQTQSLETTLRNKAESTGYQSTSGPTLEKLADVQEAQLRDALVTGTGQFQRVGAEEADTAVQTGLERWRTTSKELLTRELTGTTGVSKMKFDASNLKAAAEDLGIYANAPSGEVVQVSGPRGQLAGIVNKIDQMTTSMAQATGPEAGQTVRSAAEQIVSLRDQLFQMSKTGSQEQREYATRLWQETKNMMENPVGTRGTLANARIQRASQAFSDYEERQGLFAGYLKNEDPKGLADRLFQPGKFDTLEAFKQVAPEEFQRAKDAFYTKFFDNPADAGKFLDSFTKSNNEGTLRLIMSEKEEAAWRTFSKGYKQFEDARYVRLTSADQTGQRNAEAMIFGGSDLEAQAGTKVTIKQGELERFIRQTGGKDSAQANDLRAGIYARVLRSATETSSEAGGAQTINPGKIKNTINELLANRDNLAPLMRPQDIQALEDFRTYATMLEGTALGGQLQTQSQIARLANIPMAFENPQHYALTILSMFRQDRIARVMSNPVSSNMMIQAIQAGPTREGLRMFNGAIAVALEGAVKNRKEDRQE